MIVHLSTTHKVNDPRISSRIRKSLNDLGENSIVVGKAVKNHTYKEDIFFPRFIENQRIAVIFFNFFFILMHRRGVVFFIHDLELLILVPVLKLMQKIVVYDVHENFRDLMPSRPHVPKILKIPIRFAIISFENIFSFFCDFITYPTTKIK